MSLKRQQGKEPMVLPDNGRLFRQNEQWNDMEEYQIHLTKWKKSVWKDYMLYDANYMIFWKRQNYGDTVNIIGCQGFRGGMNNWSTEDT